MKLEKERIIMEKMKDYLSKLCNALDETTTVTKLDALLMLLTAMLVGCTIGMRVAQKKACRCRRERHHCLCRHEDECEEE